jgi:tetratricopeptide (TPR) repeat protein
LPVWQALREELKDKNFEVISVALDTKGNAAAEQWIRAADAQHPSLIDTQHVVVKLYNTRNVPSGIWIDEEGRIVRPAETASGRIRQQGATEATTHEKYLNALRDWVAKGRQSIYALGESEIKQRMNILTAEDAQAAAHFGLGAYLYQQGHSADAIPHFKQAHALKPENWNYKRQAFSLGNPEEDYGTTIQKEQQAPGAPPFRVPLDMPDLPVAAS